MHFHGRCIKVFEIRRIFYKLESVRQKGKLDSDNLVFITTLSKKIYIYFVKLI